MKTELPQIYFTFDPANQTIDFSATPSFDPARLFAVMNITDQQKLIYAVASYAQGFGGSFSGSVLTLSYDTTSMSAGDILQVIYDDPTAIQDVEVTNFPSVQDVDVVSSVLPPDASTATLQGVGNASLSSIDGKIITTVDGIKVDGSAVTQPVSAASLPLPAGASTEATLLSVDGKITVVDTSDVTITGALPSGTNTIGKVDVNGTIPVSGSVSVSNFPVTQDVNVTVSVLPPDAATETTLSALNAKVVTADTGNVAITSPLPAGSNLIGSVDINSGSIIADLIAEAPTGGAVPTDAVYIAGNDSGTLVGMKVSSTGVVSVDGSATTQPISATSLPLPTGAASETTLSSLDTKITTTPNGIRVDPGSITVGSSVLPTGAATEITLSSVDTKLTTTPNGLRVDPGSITVGSSVLPTGAATETTLSSVDTKLTTTPNGLRVDAVGTIDIGSSVLPTGAATETTLSSIDTKLTTTPNGLRVDAVGTIDIGSSVLPTGAATESTLSSLDGKVTTTPNGIKVDATVTFPSSQDVNLHDGAGTAITSTLTGGKQALDVNFAGGSISVTATNPSVSNTGSTTPVQATFVGGTDGTNLVGVKVSPSGVVSVDGSMTTQPISAMSLPLPMGASTDSSVLSVYNELTTLNNKITSNQYQNQILVNANNDVFGAPVIGSKYNQYEIDFQSAPSASLITTTTSGGATITYSNGHAIYNSSSSTTAQCKGVSTSSLEYRPGNEAYAMFTASFTKVVTVNAYQRIGLYNNTNGFFIGCEGRFFGITKRTNGVDTFINESDFNGDKLDGLSGSKFTRNGSPEAIVYSNANLFRIRFGWLGSANILFEIMSPDGNWVIFHTIRQPNSSFDPSITSTSLPLTIDIQKTTGSASTSLIMGTACWAFGTTSGYSKITSTLTDNSLASVNRSVITGVTTGGGGGYVNVKVNPSGALVTDSTISGTVAATQSGTWDINNVTGTVSLPTGAATSANQTTANASLSSIDGKLTSVTVGTLPSIPAGSNNIGSITDITGTVSLPTGASTSALQTTANTTLSNISTYTLAISNQLPPSIGEQGKLNSLSVTLASDSSPIAIKPNQKGQFIRSQYDLNPVNTSTYYELIPSTTSAYSAVEIFDSSGQTLVLAIGASGFEVDQFLIFPGGNGRIPYQFNSGSRISILALSGDATSGEICLNFYI